MKKWIDLIAWILKRQLDPDVWSALSQLVATVENQAMTGAEKRAWVVKHLFLSPPGPLREAIAKTAGWLINLALEAIVAKRKIAGG
jgi:hypothetical protein